MPYTTMNQYISWESCQAQCPTQAIKRFNHHYCIDRELCNGCKSYGSRKCGTAFLSGDRCVSIFDDENIIPNQDIYPKDSNDYWESWFTTYARLVKTLRTTQQPAV